MPAQILPMVSEVSQQRQQLDYALGMQQMENQRQLMGLRQAEFENERALNPLRQQLLQQDLMNRKQAFEIAAKQQSQADAEAPYRIGRMKDESASAAQGLTNAKTQGSLLEQEYATRERKNKEDAEDRPLHKELLKNTVDKSKVDLDRSTQAYGFANAEEAYNVQKRAQELKYGAGKNEEQQRSAAIQTAAMIQSASDIADPDRRAQIADNYLKHGVITQQDAQAIKSASPSGVPNQAFVEAYLGKIWAEEYAKSTAIANRPPDLTNPDTMAKEKDRQAQEAAFRNKAFIIEKAMKAWQDKTGSGLPIPKDENGKQLSSDPGDYTKGMVYIIPPQAPGQAPRKVRYNGKQNKGVVDPNSFDPVP